MLPFVLTNLTAALILNGCYFIWLVPEIIHTFAHRVEPKSWTNDPYSGQAVKISLVTAVLLANWLVRVQTWATIAWQPVA